MKFTNYDYKWLHLSKKLLCLKKNRMALLLAHWSNRLLHITRKDFRLNAKNLIQECKMPLKLLKNFISRFQKTNLNLTSWLTCLLKTGKLTLIYRTSLAVVRNSLPKISSWSRLSKTSTYLQPKC